MAYTGTAELYHTVGFIMPCYLYVVEMLVPYQNSSALIDNVQRPLNLPRHANCRCRQSLKISRFSDISECSYLSTFIEIVASSFSAMAS